MRTYDRESRERTGVSSSHQSEGAMDPDHVNKFFEARKHDKTVASGVRASTNELGGSSTKSMMKDYSSYNLSALDRELAKQRQAGNSSEVISILLAKVKQPSLDATARKKVLLDLLLELVNARKLAHVGEFLRSHRGKVDIGEEEGYEYFNLNSGSGWTYFSMCFDLLQLIQIEQVGDTTARGEYIETGYDYLKRVVQVIEMEFRINQSFKGSSGYLYALGQGPIGISKDSKLYVTQYSSPVVIDSLLNRKVISVSCGDSHVIALMECIHPTGESVMERTIPNRVMRDVMGWGENNLGQVTGNLKVSRYATPQVINYFFGKDIKEVSCYRSKSAAVEQNGTIYEWGGETSRSIHISQKIQGCHSLQHGQGFSAVMANSKVYVWGELKAKGRIVFVEKEARMVSENLSISKFSVGSDHILAVDDEGQVYGLGSNEFNQLGLDASTESSRKFIPSTSFSESVSNVWALNQISIVQTQGNGDEYQYVGLVKKDPLSNLKFLISEIAKYPEDFVLAQGVAPKKFTYFNHQIYALGTNGRIYLWDSRVTMGFKEELLGQDELFSDLQIGRGYTIMSKPFMIPENCRLLCDTEVPLTFEPITCCLELRGEEGPLGCNPSANIRLGVMLLTGEGTGKVKYVEEYARDMLKYFDSLPSGSDKKVLVGDLDDTGEVVLNKLKYSEKMEAGVVKFSFFVKQSGVFNLAVSVNEKRVRDLMRFTVEDNPAAVDPDEEAPEVDWRVREAEEERAEKEREKKFLAQKKKEKEEELRRAQEELKQQLNQKTQERADAALRAKIIEVEARKMRDSQMKKGMADARVGGGYDIEKLSKLRGQKEPAITNKSPGQISTSVSQNKDSTTTIMTEVIGHGASDTGVEVVSQYGRGMDHSDSQRFLSQKDDADYSESGQYNIGTSQDFNNPSSMKRPGSNSFKIRDVSIKNRGSRPGSRLQDSQNFDQGARQSVTSSMIGPIDPMFERGNTLIMNTMIGAGGQRPDSGLDKRQPVRVIVKTGDNFYSKEGGNPGDISPAQLIEAMRESRDGGRRLVGGGSIRDRLGGASNGKSYVRGNSMAGAPVKSIALVRGVSQDKGRTVGRAGESEEGSDGKTAPKRTKAGLSMGKKPADPYKMPQIGRANALASGPKRR